MKAYNYTLNYTYGGQNFFDDFTFDTAWNCGGYIQYMNESYCKQNSLINISSSGQIFMGVHHTNKLIVGDQGRPSVKINTQNVISLHTNSTSNFNGINDTEIMTGKW